MSNQNTFQIHKAIKIFDGEKFIDENTIVVKDGFISDIIYLSDDNISFSDDIKINIHNGIIVPGFVNAHCHLELSYLHNQFERYTGMVGFLNQMLTKRYLFNEELIVERADEWDKKMRQEGIVAVGDIVNEQNDNIFEIKKGSKIQYINFIETFGLSKDKAEKNFLKASNVFDSLMQFQLLSNIVPHSLYSLSEELWDYYIKFSNDFKYLISTGSIHFLESLAEKKLLYGEESEMGKYFMEQLGFQENDFKHIKDKYKTYFERYIHKNKRNILVHNTYVGERELHWLDSYRDKIYFCLCPNANLFIEQKLPDVTLLQEFTNQICIGTDSLASNDDLSIIKEMNVLLENFHIKIEDVLQWATLNGAKALGIETQFGLIKKNYKSHFNVIEVKDNYLRLLTSI